jgi:hypothetical protein
MRELIEIAKQRALAQRAVASVRTGSGAIRTGSGAIRK